MSSSKGPANYKAGNRLAACLLAAAAGCTLAGCGAGSTTDLRKGFLDPTAVGRYQKQTLSVPILSSLDRNMDVGDDRFRTSTDVTAEDLNPSNRDYTIGRNDLVSIAITDLVAPNVETVRTPRVSESGTVSLPIIGQIKAAGLTEAELEKQITTAYRQAQVIQNAQVSVAVMEARARTFSILGTVTAPGQYAILNSDFRLLDALVLARDVNSQGIDNIYIIRQLDKQEPATVPSAPQEPDTGGDDVLTPRSDAGASHVIMAQASPTTTGASGAITSDDQRFITVDGKELTVEQPATADAAAPTTAVVVETPATREIPPSSEAVDPVVTPAGTDSAAVATPAPSGEFAFNDPVAEGKTRVIRVPYEALRNGDLRYNVVIKPYDLIIVPTPVVGEYYMGGHVQRVGVYSLTARKITLKQAIISAGMFDQIAVPTQTDVIRRVSGDNEIFVKVDLDKVFAGEQPDIFLRPNDVVQVGTSWWAPFAAAVRGGIRMTYGFGFLYDRNFGDPDDPNSF